MQMKDQSKEAKTKKKKTKTKKLSHSLAMDYLIFKIRIISSKTLFCLFMPSPKAKKPQQIGFKAYDAKV